MATRKNQKSKIKNQKLDLETQDLSSSSVNNSSILDKLRQPKIFITLIIILLVVLAFPLRGLFIVALVNGQPITRLTLIQELEKQGGRQALNSLVNQTLILQEAKKKNINISQEEVDKSSKQIEDSLKKQGQNLGQALEIQGLTKKDFLMQLKLRSIVEKLLADQIKVTDKQVSDYIEKNKEFLPTDLKESEIKKGVKQQLEQQKLASKSQEWIANLTKNAKIHYSVAY